jgi:hypothetical protein
VECRVRLWHTIIFVIYELCILVVAFAHFKVANYSRCMTIVLPIPCRFMGSYSATVDMPSMATCMRSRMPSSSELPVIPSCFRD